MSAGMAGIIAAHQPRYLMPGNGADSMECECGRWQGDVVEDHAAHLAAELATAGYGNVQETRTVEVHHHDIERHAESFNEGYEAAMVLPLMSEQEIEEHGPGAWLRQRIDAAVLVALLTAADAMEADPQFRDPLRLNSDRLRMYAHALDHEGRALVQAIHDRKAKQCTTRQ